MKRIDMPISSLERPHQVEDLRLDRHVERRRRLVGDQELRVARQRHGDHDALAHPARHLVGVVLDALPGLGDPDQVEHLGGLSHGRVVALLLVEHDGLGDLVTDGVHRVQAGHRLLEDHRDLVAADAAHLALALLDQVLALEQHLTARDASRGNGDEAHDRQAGHGLPRAGLTDDGEGLALVEVEAHTVDGLDRAFIGIEVGLQVDDVQQAIGTGHQG
jgi:hypothetical protein